MPSNEELLRMEGVGVRIIPHLNGWQTTVIRCDENGGLHEETWPMRISFDLAHRDQRRFAPFVHLCRWQMTMCERGLWALECGVKKESGTP